jgi:hypothetical protein
VKAKVINNTEMNCLSSVEAYKQQKKSQVSVKILTVITIEALLSVMIKSLKFSLKFMERQKITSKGPELLIPMS